MAHLSHFLCVITGQHWSSSVGYPFLGLWVRPGPPEPRVISWWHHCHAHMGGHGCVPGTANTEGQEKNACPVFATAKWLVPPDRCGQQSLLLGRVLSAPLADTCYVPFWVSRNPCVHLFPSQLHCPSPSKLFTSALCGEQAWFLF